MSKSELRKCMSAIVGRLSSLEKQEQSRVVFEKLIKHPKYVEAKRLFIYLSTDNELDTRPILRHALDCCDDNKQCFVPFVRKRAIKADDRFVTRMLMVQLASMDDYDQLPVNHYGIKEHKDLADCVRIAEPGVDAAGAAADLILVPGVAFARDGRRLGHGKGYYDEFLHHWRAVAGGSNQMPNGGPYTIGLALNEQLVEDPMAVAGHDFQLDEVICAHQ